MKIQFETAIELPEREQTEFYQVLSAEIVKITEDFGISEFTLHVQGLTLADGGEYHRVGRLLTPEELDVLRNERGYDFDMAGRPKENK